MTSSFAKANNSSVSEEKAIPYWKKPGFNELLPKHAHRAMVLMGNSSQFLMSSHSLSLMAFSAFSILPGKLCLENHFPLPFPSPSSSFLLCLLGYFLLVFLLARRYPLGQVTEIEYFPPI